MVAVVITTVAVTVAAGVVVAVAVGGATTMVEGWGRRAPPDLPPHLQGAQDTDGESESRRPPACCRGGRRGTEVKPLSARPVTLPGPASRPGRSLGPGSDTNDIWPT